MTMSPWGYGILTQFARVCTLSVIWTYLHHTWATDRFNTFAV